jgi:hypothetical protein
MGLSHDADGGDDVEQHAHRRAQASTGRNNALLTSLPKGRPLAPVRAIGVGQSTEIREEMPKEGNGDVAARPHTRCMEKPGATAGLHLCETGFTDASRATLTRSGLD